MRFHEMAPMPAAGDVTPAVLAIGRPDFPNILIDTLRRQAGVGAPARGEDARDVVLPGKEVAVKWLGKVHVAVLVSEKQYIDPARQQLHQISAVFEPVGEPLFDP